MTHSAHDKILILHNNSVYAQSIARAIRAIHVYCELMPLATKDETLSSAKPSGLIILSETPSERNFSMITPNILTISTDCAFSATIATTATDFVRTTCACAPTWTTDAIIAQHVQAIKQQVGDDEVMLALSGGVDSSVVAALLHKALGAKLTCIFVDTGLMRLHEGDYVMRIFAENMGVNVLRINAEARFLGALKGIVDPEHKRKIIGKLFIDIFEEEAHKLNHAKWLAQGTIYPDILESLSALDGSGVAVKSHHNVGGLPEKMDLKLIEPLADLFKDEVRVLGVALGLPAEMVYRHPFPGPGLGVRILGEVTKDYADILRLADALFIEALVAADLYHKTSQAFAVFLPVKSVGLHNGERCYEYVIALRAIETIDFVHARAAHLPYDFIEKISTHIIETLPQVSRVVYDVSNKPPATIEWE